MKVFGCYRNGGYSGGLAIVAANTKEEAFEVFHSDEMYVYMLDCIDDNGNFTSDVKKCNSTTYRREDWFEMTLLEAKVKTPCILAEDGYTE